jgi:parallel beta-helix repeat protein
MVTARAFSARWRIKELAAAVLLLLAFPVLGNAATYYIDYASGSDANPGTQAAPWKLAPGMAGFSGNYAHQAGDVFVFKGGVTWPSTALPLTVVGSGTSASSDVYKSDKSWFAGSAFTKPIFDGAHNGRLLWSAADKSWVIVDGLEFDNVGVANVQSSDYGMSWNRCAHFAVQNSTFRTYSWIGMFLEWTGQSGTWSDVKITGNDLSNVSMAIVAATGAANAVVDAVEISQNAIHDLSSKMVGTVHGDGIHVWGNSTDASQYFTNLRIDGNLFYGDFSGSAGMTADIFIEDATSNALIYNNVASYTNTGSNDNFGALINMHNHTGGTGGFKIFSNTLILGSRPYGIFVQSAPNTVVANNIIYSGSQGVALSSSSGTSIDYEDDTSVSPSPGPHGITSNPDFVSTTDFHLQPASPALQAGENLSQYATVDKDNQPRPSSGAWAIGAYQGGLQAPAPPTNVRIIR